MSGAVVLPMMCPYCRHQNLIGCLRPESHDVVHACTACLGRFVARFTIRIRAFALTIQGESDRVADEQDERLKLERMRVAEGRVE
ncbi:MAG: hypothetical protein ABI640_13070 [Gammaproteobacteria bacterium]